ncbi:hypothetical protein Pcinc_037193, partial [Petrolisthes cinctipes]
ISTNYINCGVILFFSDVTLS